MRDEIEHTPAEIFHTDSTTNQNCEQTEKRNVNEVGKFDGRILRSRQYRRPFEDNRPIKRLFTPEIKRLLKSWLVRRRENPYPSREEKIDLAKQTGLTYIQICNWFANWRRKLKNSGKNINKFTWSTLIKSYNDQALGNVEHLSISSDDSIWEETEIADRSKAYDIKLSSQLNQTVDHCYTSLQNNREKTTEPVENTGGKPFAGPTDQSTNSDFLPQCFQISSTTDFIIDQHKPVENKKKMTLFSKFHKTNAKACDKYLGTKRRKSNRDKNWNYRGMLEEKRTCSNHSICSKECKIQGDPLLLSKWKKSAALFQPKNYSAGGCVDKRSRNFHVQYENLHGREELDAAEALTFLSRASATKLT